MRSYRSCTTLLLPLLVLGLTLHHVPRAQERSALRSPGEIWVDGTSLARFLEIHNAGLMPILAKQRGHTDHTRIEAQLADFLEQRGLSLSSLKEADLSRADLRDEDLRYLNLKEADLCGAAIDNADLRSVNLKEANLRGASMESADLRGTNMKEADLTDADCRGADLETANLKEANLENADLTGSNLRKADLHEATGLTLKQLMSARSIQDARLPEGYRIRLLEISPEMFEK
ncbi:MAG: pentapeptide repeat-containing protein [Bacteroidetes bacterium]|nr:pentapeptide repeat-containing protein [Bacteroidota bacterium]